VKSLPGLYEEAIERNDRKAVGMLRGVIFYYTRLGGTGSPGIFRYDFYVVSR
jgi:hypothetical protein